MGLIINNINVGIANLTINGKLCWDGPDLLVPIITLLRSSTNERYGSIPD